MDDDHAELIDDLAESGHNAYLVKVHATGIPIEPDQDKPYAELNDKDREGVRAAVAGVFAGIYAAGYRVVRVSGRLAS